MFNKLVEIKKGHQVNDALSSLNQQSTQPKNQAYSLSPNLARWMPCTNSVQLRFLSKKLSM